MEIDTRFEVGELLAGVEVFDVNGAKVLLAGLWRDDPAVLVFVRHFGWMLCREQIAQLRDVNDDIRARNARLVFIGNGSPDQARALVRELDLDVPLYTDPDRRGFAALGAQRRVAGVFHPGSLRSALRAWRGGHRQQGVQGDALQLGAVVIVRPGNDVVYLHRSAYAGDHPSPADILQQLWAEAQKGLWYQVGMLMDEHHLEPQPDRGIPLSFEGVAVLGYRGARQRG